jgi:hypothetical protein
MEQLKQVLKYQFWILLGVALIIPFVGWFMSRSMMAEALARSDILKKKNDSLVVRPDDPNETWGQQVGVINTEQEKQALLAWRALYERQKPFMVWPKRMVNDPSKIENYHQVVYRTDYAEELNRVRQIVKPYDEENEKGLVRYSEELLPNPNSEWTYQAPTVEQIVAAQEDLWLLTAILSAIASVNEGASSVYDAPVREIVELLLRGGSPKGSSSSGGALAKSSGGTAAAPGAAGTAAGMATMMLRGGGGISGRADSSLGSIADHKINPTEDLGAERAVASAKTDASPAASGTGLQKGAGPAGSPTMLMPGGDRDMLMVPSSAGSNRGGASGTNRYCDEKKEWRTRGFSLEVIMEHRRVPDLLVALSNAEGWPINILRVHVADSSDGDLVGTEGASPAGDMPTRSMMSPGMKRSGSGASPMPVGGPASRGAAPSAAPSSLKSRPPTSRRSDRDDDVAPSNNAPSALDDPNLAKVSIVGVIYIFLQPKELPVTPPPSQTPGAPQTPVAAAPADPTTATTDAGASSEEAGADSNVDEKPESKTGESTDEPAAAAPDAGADPKPKPDAEGKPESGDSR